MLSDWAGGTTGSSSPCSSRIGQVSGVHVPDGRALRVDGLIARQRPDETVQVMRLEVVRGLGEAAQVGDAEVGRRRAEDLARPDRAGGDGGQRSPAAGRAAADGEPGRVRVLGLRHPLRGGDRVLHVHNAPLTAQPLAVLAAVAGRAAVVHVDDADATAGEVRLVQVEHAGHLPGRTAVHPHDVGRALVVGAARFRVGRRVQLRVHDLAVWSLEVDLPRHRQVCLVRQVGKIALQYLGLAGVRVHPDDGRPAERGRPRRRRSSCRRPTTSGRSR